MSDDYGTVTPLPGIPTQDFRRAGQVDPGRLPMDQFATATSAAVGELHRQQAQQAQMRPLLEHADVLRRRTQALKQRTTQRRMMWGLPAVGGAVSRCPWAVAPRAETLVATLTARTEPFLTSAQRDEVNALLTTCSRPAGIAGMLQ